MKTRVSLRYFVNDCSFLCCKDTYLQEIDRTPFLSFRFVTGKLLSCFFQATVQVLNEFEFFHGRTTLYVFLLIFLEILRVPAFQISRKEKQMLRSANILSEIQDLETRDQRIKSNFSLSFLLLLFCFLAGGPPTVLDFPNVKMQ